MSSNSEQGALPVVGPHDRASRDRWSGIALALLLFAAFALVAGRIFAIASGPLPPKAGAVAPELSAPSLEGTIGGLEQYRGRVVLVDFWATWCPPCVAAMPGLERLHQAYADRGLTVLGVNIEPGDEPQVRAFVKQRELHFPVVVDPGDIARRYGVYSYPTSFVVGRDGIIRRVFRGPADEVALRGAIESALGPR